MNTKTVVGVFQNRSDATAALRDLRDAGFDESQIGVISKNAHDPKREDHTGLADDPTGTRWEEGTGIGAAAGAATGLGLGVAVAAGLIPAVGPVIAGGTLVALLASAGAGAATGTIVGGLIGLGIPEEEASSYETEVNEGRTLVTVSAGDRYPEALDVFRRNSGLVRANVPGAAY
jgi:hypothetical protein